MDKLLLINKYFNLQKSTIKKAIDAAKETRDNSPSAMESHSDTTRSQNEKMVMALEYDLKKLNNLAAFVKESDLTYIEANMGGEIKKILLVPSGLGGQEFDGIRMLSRDAPLGVLLSNKNVGDIFEFNNNPMQVVVLE